MKKKVVNSAYDNMLTQAGALLNIIEDLLGEAPDHDNFIKTNCFHSSDARYA